MKKVFPIIITVSCTFAILTIMYFIQYPTRLDKSSMETALQEFDDINSIKIQKVKTIDNKIIVLYTSNSTSGFGTYIKGYNGRCQLVSSKSDYVVNTFHLGRLKTNKGSYILFGGKNYDNKIKSIEFDFEDGKKPIYDVPKGNYFILSISSPSNAVYIGYDLLDEKGDSIKDEITSKYLENNTGSAGRTSFENQVRFNFWYVFVTFISIVVIYSICNVNRKNIISK